MTGLVPACRQTENGVAISGYSHLNRWERDQIAGPKAVGRNRHVRPPTVLSCAFGGHRSYVERVSSPQTRPGGLLTWVESGFQVPGVPLVTHFQPRISRTVVFGVGPHRSSCGVAVQSTARAPEVASRLSVKPVVALAVTQTRSSPSAASATE